MILRDKTAPKAGKVLVVNSDPEIRRILEVNLAHANLEVVLAESSAAALEKIRRDKSDIVILDQELIDTESGDICSRIKELSETIPVILIGSRLKKRNIDIKADETAVSYVAKPFDPREVVSLVQEYLMHKRRTVNIDPLTRRPNHSQTNKEVASDKAKGTVRTVNISKKWQSSPQRVDSLQIAMDISRKEAREALKNMQRIVASLVEKVPPALKDSFDRLSGDIQELAVLCNRSLYMIHDFNSRLETQQDRLLQQESEQLAMSEAILTICRNIARSMHVRVLFDLESSRRVVKYALVISRELGISDLERQALHHASLLKDISLAFSRPHIIEQMVSTGRDTAAALKERLNLIWKALATIPFLVNACNFLLYKYERYDGTGGTFGLKGADTPLGARVLAVADAFETLTSARSPQGKMAPELAVQQIVAESGLSFDPHIVSALLMLWKKNEIGSIVTEDKGEIGLGVPLE
jgi:response regulator RpfG family c-di-GMP phosphodiesterase